MRAATNKHYIALAGAIFLLLFVPSGASAQSLGGTSATDLLSQSGASYFQSGSNAQQTSETQSATSTAVLQQATTTTLAVVGAPAYVAPEVEPTKMADGYEMYAVIGLLAIGCIGALLLLRRMLKNSY